MVGIIVVRVFTCFCIIIFGYINQPKQLVARKFIKFRIHMSGMVRRLEGKTGSFNGDGSVKTRVSYVVGIDSWCSLIWCQFSATFYAVWIFMDRQTCLFRLFENYILWNFYHVGIHVHKIVGYKSDKLLLLN